ncbi:MAG: hypothetical protein AB7H93_10230 [Vicinamibacterales bacterium]
MQRPSLSDALRGITRMACPVCFTGDDPILRDSLSAGIGVLVAVTLVVLACFATFFVVLARRARAAALAEDAAAAPPATPRLQPLPGDAR